MQEEFKLKSITSNNRYSSKQKSKYNETESSMTNAETECDDLCLQAKKQFKFGTACSDRKPSQQHTSKDRRRTDSSYLQITAKKPNTQLSSCSSKPHISRPSSQAPFKKSFVVGYPPRSALPGARRKNGSMCQVEKMRSTNTTMQKQDQVGRVSERLINQPKHN